MEEKRFTKTTSIKPLLGMKINKYFKQELDAFVF